MILDALAGLALPLVLAGVWWLTKAPGETLRQATRTLAARNPGLFVKHKDGRWRLKR